MADYFKMMQDVVGSYGEGLDLARSRARFDAEEARRATKFNQEQEQYERTRGIQRDTDAAFGTYKALQDGVYDGTKADFSGLPQGIDAGPVRDVAPVTGLGGGDVPKRAATRLENIGARRNIAAATQDFGSLGKLEEESRSAEWDDSFSKHYKSYTASPEQVAEAAKHINTNSKSITLHDPDKQGFRQMSVVAPDGTATLLKLGKHDQAQLWAASQLMDLDPQKALALMHGIDKTLAAAVAAENGIVDKVGQHQNTMAYQKGQLSEAQQRTAIARAGLGNKPREMSPETVAKLNNLSSAIAEEKDPAKRAVLGAQFRRQYGLAATQLGKVLMPTDERAPKVEYSNKDVADLVSELRTDKANKGLPYETLRKMAIGILDPRQAGVQDGGLADDVYGSKPAPAAPAPAAKPTAIAPPPSSRAQAAYDAYMASRPSWFQQETPTSRARTAALEQEYLDALKNPSR